MGIGIGLRKTLKWSPVIATEGWRPGREREEGRVSGVPAFENLSFTATEWDCLPLSRIRAIPVDLKRICFKLREATYLRVPTANPVPLIPL